MGTNNISTKNAGDVIASADPNQYKTALGVDIVPRNSSGVPTDIAGGLGSTLYRWASSYINKIFLGTASHGVAIQESGTIFQIEIDGTVQMQTGRTGVDGSYFKANSVTYDKIAIGSEDRIRSQSFSADGTFTVPTLVTRIFVLMCGGGGGGGGGSGGSGANGSGGSGGGGGGIVFGALDVTASEQLIIDVGANGGGGAAGGGSSNGADGTIGQPSYVKRGSTALLTAYGGIAGDGALVLTGGVTVGGTMTGGAWRSEGGSGGDSPNGDGANGGATPYATGGVAGTVNGAGGGGGGGASLGAGGAGGNGAAQGGSQGGPGGGGGGGAGGSGSGGGGVGASGTDGQVIIYWVGQP